MIRDGILRTKHHELGNVVVNRKRKLQELYHATVALAGPDESTAEFSQNGGQGLSETAFLDANDILKERYFDVNTLLRIHSGQNELVKTLTTSAAFEARHASPFKSTDYVNLQEVPPGSTKSPHLTSDASYHAGYNGVEALQGVVPDRDSAPSGLKNGEAPKDAGSNLTAEVAADTSVQENGESPFDGESRQHRGTKVLEGQSEAYAQSRRNGTTPNKSFAIEADDTDHTALANAKGVLSEHCVQGRATPVPSDLQSFQPAQATPTPPPLIVSVGPSDQPPSEAVNSTQLAANRNGIPDSQPATGIISEDREAPDRVVESSSVKNDLRIPQSRISESTLAMRRSPSKNQSPTRKGHIRIDTDISRRDSLYDTQPTSGSATPLRSVQSAMQSSPPERMTTRVSSGALRHKSVSEILGETPRSAVGEDKVSSDLQSPDDRGVGTQTPISGRLLASPDSATFRSRLSELKEREKDRSKLSAVVFPRQLAENQQIQQSRSEESPRRGRTLEPKDYLVSLFATQATAQVPPLNDLMASSSKILNTDNHYLLYREAQDSRILKRIYHLQNSNRWSLRQISRSKEPERPLSHWDMLLGEVKWMRTDFREERKWKTTAAKNLAEWCAEWVNSSPEKRTALQVKVHKAPHFSHEDSHITPVSMANASGSSHSETTPDLIPSMLDDASDSADDEVPNVDLSKSIAPAALFSLAPEDVIFQVDRTPVADKLLEELPLHRVYEQGQGEKRKYSEILDSEWQKPLVPVSKYATGKLTLKEQGPVRKRSRFEYEQEDEVGLDSSGRTFLPLGHGKISLVPEKDDVALFDPVNKHIISRLHAAHAFRPPSEFNMPPQSFFESRSSSQWTVAEDDQLRRLVREYEYNWSLIAACCSSPALFTSSAERRTPWECFERWVSFEGLPGDMAKHQYFRAWNGRRDAARERLHNIFLAQQRGNDASQTPVRRRSVEPVTVGQRRQTKHVALVHSMCKLAKKREAAIQKQQHVASLAAMRKAAEPAQPRQRMQTPREFSAHKHKQECDYREKQLLYRQQLAAASQRAALAQKAAQQVGQQSGAMAQQTGRNSLPGQPNGAGNNHLSSMTPNGMPPSTRAASHPTMMAGAVSNGNQTAGSQVGTRGAGNVPQASMQSYLQNQQRISSQNGQERIVHEVARLQEQQRVQQQRQQQGQSNLGNLSSGSYNNNANIPIQHNSSMMASVQAANGKLSPAANGNPTQLRSSASPGLGANVQLQQASSGVNPVLNQISNHYKAMNPNATPEQIKQMATQHLSQQLRNYQANNLNLNLNLNLNMPINSNMQLSPQQQMAFNAGPSGMNPQLYQYIRSQQASQQGSRNSTAGGGSSSPTGEINGVRPGSQGSAGTMQNRSGSIPNGASQSPRPPQAQMAGSS